MKQVKATLSEIPAKREVKWNALNAWFVRVGMDIKNPPPKYYSSLNASDICSRLDLCRSDVWFVWFTVIICPSWACASIEHYSQVYGYHTVGDNL